MQTDSLASDGARQPPSADQLEQLPEAEEALEYARLKHALASIPVTNFAECARIGRPLKELGDFGRALWEQHCAKVWSAFDRHGMWDMICDDGSDYREIYRIAEEHKPLPAAETPPIRVVDGATFLTPEQQREVFKGCVYVLDQHRVLIPGGRLVRPEQFRAMYGGYTFIMDARNERTSKDAFEAFTQSQAQRAPRADATCFKPLLPPGCLVQQGQRVLVNVWAPEPVRRVQGDPSPFLRHLEKLFPDATDQQLILYYLANMVQRVGHKFQFAPVIIGVPGNGKTFISNCAVESLGHRYVHWPDAQKIGNQFNGWMAGRVAYLVEDAYLGGKVDLLEKLKPMITGKWIEIEGKGVDQRSEEVCGNFIFNANHQNAVRKTIDDRRYMTLWCHQQAVADLERDGLTPSYFERLYSWANADGYAIVAEYLHTLRIPPEFGLSWVMGRAPRTSSTDRAIDATRSPIEQEILAAVEEGALGFKGGWISTTYLRKLVERLQMTREVQRNHFGPLLEGLGYIVHPALQSTDGQVHNQVMPDGARPKLFVKKDSLAAHLPLRPAEVARAYSHAQGVAPSALGPRP